MIRARAPLRFRVVNEAMLTRMQTEFGYWYKGISEEISHGEHRS